jgi:hypothetical protein
MMPHLSIPIPETMDKTRRRALTSWLTELVEQVSSDDALDASPEVQQELARRAQRGADDFEAGRFYTQEQARARLAALLQQP